MIDDLDILRAANLLLKRYGADARFRPRNVPMSEECHALAKSAERVLIRDNIRQTRR